MPQVNLFPEDTIKFRENSADSVVFHLADHTPELPRTITWTRTLPAPRKGNNGTMKVQVNVRHTIKIGDTDPKIVPVITKLETSVPVGTPLAQLISGPFNSIADLLGPYNRTVDHMSELENLFITGLLPSVEGGYVTRPGDV